MAVYSTAVEIILLKPVYMKILLPAILLLLSIPSFSQKETATISGYIQDASTGEKLIGAGVYDVKSGQGARTNVYGFFSLTLPKDSVQLRIMYVGYETIEMRLKLDGDQTINAEIRTSEELESVVIKGKESIQDETQMSSMSLSMAKVKALPVFMGEVDIMKTIQLLPGIQSGSEGASGIYVRGGGPDQNLVLLDGVPVYNASHLFGFFSVFNADAINNVQLIKGGFPARYGGRLSSVIDIRMKEGNMKEFHGEGSIGLISSKLTLEGPIKKDKTSFLISARRTYIDLLARPIIKATAEGNVGGYFFYDLNGKINHKFSDKSRLYFSAYNGKDRAYIKYDESRLENAVRTTQSYDQSLEWGNFISALRWNYIINPKLFMNVTGTYSRYKFNVGFDFSSSEVGPGINNQQNYKFDYISGINDWSGKVDFDYSPNANHSIKFGTGYIYHTFTPGVNEVSSSGDGTPTDTTFGSSKQYGNELFAYIEDDFKIGKRLKANLGVHASGFLVGDKTYHSIQPRVALRYKLNELSSIKASYSRMTQFLHLLTNQSIGLPTDLWVPVTDSIPPQQSDQFAIGYARTVKKDYELSVEAYYKTMENVIEYKDGASFVGNDKDWQKKVEIGKGWSYGAEILFEKKVGKTTGWIGYTLSWTERQFDGLNFGEKFPYRYDRRHDIGVAVTHKFNDRVDVGLVWVYGTGNAVTLGLERYLSFDNVFGSGAGEIEHIESRNNYRMPAYHRLDLGVNLHKKKKWGEQTWSFGVYNAYSRQNPFFLEFGYNNNNQRVLKQYSLFPIIPSFNYSFKF